MDDVPESSNVTSSWLAHISVLLAITTLVLVVLEIGIKLNSSLSEINNLNLQVVELRGQLTQRQKEKRDLKECEEEVKNLTEVKGRFLAMKEESNNSLAVVKRADDLLDQLSQKNANTEDHLVKCTEHLREVEARNYDLVHNITQFIREHAVNSQQYNIVKEQLANCLEKQERYT